MAQRRSNQLLAAAAPILAIALLTGSPSPAVAQETPTISTRAASAGSNTAQQAQDANRPLNWDAVVSPIRRVRPTTPALAKPPESKSGKAKRSAQSTTPAAPAAKKNSPERATNGPGGGLKCAPGYTYDAKQLRCTKPGAAAPAPRVGPKKAAAPASKK